MMNLLTKVRSLFIALICWVSLSTAFALSIGEVQVRDLPVEARETLKLIQQGGPFPYPKDGVVFGNYERILPAKKRGYYREYTVKTPGAKNRGARRIVSGGDVNKDREFYYTDDHYQSFKRIKE